MTLALQEVDASRPPQQNPVVWVAVEPLLPPAGPPSPGPDMRAQANQYAFGMVACCFSRGQAA